MKVLFWVLPLFLLTYFSARDSPDEGPKDKLSEYKFFEGELRNLSPGANVVAYDLNTPLFSNYAEKLRFIYFPGGKPAAYSDSSVLSFPVGTVLIKNFLYPGDFRKPGKGRKIIETRLLVHSSSGWVAYPYIWNEEQTEAYYDPAGETREIRYVDAKGRKVTTPYVIPNTNQCKGCHSLNGSLVPIGPSARQLNRHGQLEHLSQSGLLTGLPSKESLPRLAVWNDPASGDTNARARAYLDANCGHCHSRQGAASTSGLFLTIFESDPTHLGINKSPVAAGRGAGNLDYDIVPGSPGKSILVYRMKTNDPAIAMPEIGREQLHKEAIELVESWIRHMEHK